MHLPISIKSLLQRDIVESDRVAFKADWNPELILRTICAFANDFQNFGGGYISIGVAEDNGVPILPPQGVAKTHLDKLQKELVRICSYIKPTYTPISSIETYASKNLLAIWIPGGQARPYSVPKALGKSKDYHYYIRKGSSTVIAKNDELNE